MKSDQRGKVVELLRREIPHDKKGDPCFTKLLSESFDNLEHQDEISYSPEEGSLLAVFTPEEIVTLCNRAIYQMEYQRGWHRQWERRKAQDLEPLKAKVVEMFPQLAKWTKATDEQLREAQQQLKKERGE